MEALGRCASDSDAIKEGLPTAGLDQAIHTANEC